MNKKILLPFTFCFLLLLTAGCGASEDLSLAAVGVLKVHAQMDASQFDDIYSQADEGLRKGSKKQDFLDFMNAVHRKLGKVQSASQTRYFVNFSTSGTQVRLNYQTKFESGDAEEEFLWHISGKEARLLGYHINSNALITK